MGLLSAASGRPAGFVAAGAGTSRGMPAPEESDLRVSVEELAQLPPTDLTLGEVIQHVVESTDQVLGLSGAGLILANDAHDLREVGSSDEASQIMERSEAEAGEGPCVDTVVHGRPVASDDLANDPRYPRLGPLMAEAGIHAVAGAPVPVSGITVGALNVYHDRPHQWVEPELASLAAYSRVLGNALALALLAQRHDTTAKNLRRALENRIHIERAVGYLMSALRLDAGRAFNELRADARRQRRRVVDLAKELVPAADTDR
jgi:GAF domain-containing protein